MLGARYCTRNLGAGLAALLLLGALLGAVPPAAAAPAAPRPALTPPAIPSIQFVYTFRGATYVQPYFPFAVYWTDIGTGILTYEFSVPSGSDNISVVGIPPGWQYEDAAPGAIFFGGPDIYYTSFNGSADQTSGGGVFELQLLAPLPPDPRYIDLSGQISSLLADVVGENASLTARVAAAQVLIREALQEANATYTYRLDPGLASRVGPLYTMPVFVTLASGAVANATVTTKAAAGLTVDYIDGNGSAVTPTWSTLNVGTGSFSLTVNLTKPEADSVSSGAALLTLSSPVTIGTFTNLAGGVVGASSFANASATTGWWSSIFGIETPPPFPSPSTATEIISDLAWFGGTTAGRALYMLVTLVGALGYVLAAHRMGRRAVGHPADEDRPRGAAA